MQTAAPLGSRWSTVGLTFSALPFPFSLPLTFPLPPTPRTLSLLPPRAVRCAVSANHGRASPVPSLPRPSACLAWAEGGHESRRPRADPALYGLRSAFQPEGGASCLALKLGFPRGESCSEQSLCSLGRAPQDLSSPHWLGQLRRVWQGLALSSHRHHCC